MVTKVHVEYRDWPNIELSEDTGCSSRFLVNVSELVGIIVASTRNRKFLIIYQKIKLTLNLQ